MFQPVRDPETIKAYLKEIFLQRQFSFYGGPGLLGQIKQKIYGWLNAAIDWLASVPWLAPVFRGLGDLKRGAGVTLASFLGWLWSVVSSPYGWLLVLLLGALVIWLVVKSVKGFFLRQRAYERDERETGGDEAQRLINRGKALAERGEYEEAMRDLFLALILLLHRNGIVEYDCSRTNREYLEILQRSGNTGLLDLVSDLASLHEKVVYGKCPCSAQEFQQFFAHWKSCTEP